MQKSETIAELAKALSKVQGEIKGAVKDSENPFFKSHYADLTSVWEACRELLAKNGLAVVQTMHPSESGVIVETTLLHVSGEWIGGGLHVTPVKNDPQGIGSAITYARRYALAAIVGICPADDDAEGAMGREGKPKATHKTSTKPPADFTGEIPTGNPATGKQRGLILAQLDKKGIPLDDLFTFAQVSSIEEVQFDQVNEILEWIQNWTPPPKDESDIAF